jgi:hypothetical protein
MLLHNHHKGVSYCEESAMQVQLAPEDWQHHQFMEKAHTNKAQLDREH